MEFEKSITMEDLAKIHDEITEKFIKSDNRIDNAAEIMEAALKTATDTVNELIDLISPLNEDIKFKAAVKIRKIVVATYLSAAAEVINNKQQFNDGLVSYKIASKHTG